MNSNLKKAESGSNHSSNVKVHVIDNANQVFNHLKQKGGFKILKYPFIYFCGMIACLLVLLTFTFIATSCEKTNESIPSQNDNPALQISEIQNSGCKSSTIDKILNNISLNYKDSCLYVNHSNALLNCAYDTVNVIMTVENNIITLQEEETPTDANCLCYVDITYKISPVPSGTYQVFVLFHADTVYNQIINFNLKNN
jgi:hypothetical protein